jgi:hypothetical protein
MNAKQKTVIVLWAVSTACAGFALQTDIKQQYFPVFKGSETFADLALWMAGTLIAAVFFWMLSDKNTPAKK